MDRDSNWSAGDVLGGKYRLLERLGAGGMGEVWSAEHLAIGGEVAIKLLTADVSLRPETRGRFEREARAAAALRSPHVVRVFDHGTEGGAPYIVMELLEGETLAARLARGPMSPADVARVIHHVALALTCAHDAGIVHRDLKPENVFLVAEGGSDGEELAKLLDFGIAKVTAEIAQKAAPTQTRSGSLLGTPLYMSPEQLRERPVDFRSDLWSLALVAFECSTGTTTFSGESVAEVIADVLSGHLPVPSSRAPVPEGFDAWFARAASRAPSDRFESARSMSEALAEVAGRGVAPRDATPPRVPSREPARSDTSAHARGAAVTGDGSVLISSERSLPRTSRVWIGAALALATLAITGAWALRSRSATVTPSAAVPADAPSAPPPFEPSVATSTVESSASPHTIASSATPPPSAPLSHSHSSATPPAAPLPAKPGGKQAAARPSAQPSTAPAPATSTHVLGF